MSGCGCPSRQCPVAAVWVGGRVLVSTRMHVETGSLLFEQTIFPNGTFPTNAVAKGQVCPPTSKREVGIPFESLCAKGACHRLNVWAGERWCEDGASVCVCVCVCALRMCSGEKSARTNAGGASAVMHGCECLASI